MLPLTFNTWQLIELLGNTHVHMHAHPPHIFHIEPSNIPGNHGSSNNFLEISDVASP